MRRLHANLLLLGCAAIWGFGFLFQKSAMEHIEPMLFVAARSGLAAAVLAPFAWLEHRAAQGPLSAPSFLRLSLVAGVLFAVAAILQQRGIVTASITNTAFLTALYVVVTPLLAWVLLRQPPSRPVWLAVALSFLGTWLLGGGGFVTFDGGELLVLVSTLFWGLHVIVLGKAGPFGRPILLTASQFAVAALIGLAGALAFETIDPAALWRAGFDIAFIGIFSSALAFTVFAAALRRTLPAEAAVIVSTEALFAALGAFVLLGERLTWISASGAALILAAALVVQLAAPDPAQHGAAQN